MADGGIPGGTNGRRIRRLGSDDPVRLGAYRLLGRLASGGMGRIYLARSADGSLVAVKTLLAEGALSDTDRRRFAREVQLARRIESVYTARVLDADPQDPEWPWMAIEYIPAPSLSELVRLAGRLPGSAVRWIAAGTAQALVTLHDAGIIHRDVKPQNILLPTAGPRLIDFGISHANDITRTSLTLGTIAFTSPEQARAEPSTTASDVYSLGATLFHIAVGRPPYEDTGDTIRLLTLVQRGELDLSGLPKELTPLIGPCLAADPARRPKPADVLRGFLDELDRTTTSRRGERWLPPRWTALIDEYRVQERSLREAGHDDGGPVPAADQQTRQVPPPDPTRVYTEQLGGPREQEGQTTRAADEEQRAGNARQTQQQRAREEYEHEGREARERRVREAQRRKDEEQRKRRTASERMAQALHAEQQQREGAAASSPAAGASQSAGRASGKGEAPGAGSGQRPGADRGAGKKQDPGKPAGSRRPTGAKAPDRAQGSGGAAGAGRGPGPAGSSRSGASTDRGTPAGSRASTGAAAGSSSAQKTKSGGGCFWIAALIIAISLFVWKPWEGDGQGDSGSTSGSSTSGSNSSSGTSTGLSVAGTGSGSSDVSDDTSSSSSSGTDTGGTGGSGTGDDTSPPPDPADEAFASVHTGDCLDAYQDGYGDWSQSTPRRVDCNAANAYLRVSTVGDGATVCPSGGGRDSWEHTADDLSSTTLCVERQFRNGQCFLADANGKYPGNADLRTIWNCSAGKVPQDFDFIMQITAILSSSAGTNACPADPGHYRYSWNVLDGATMVCAKVA